MNAKIYHLVKFKPKREGRILKICTICSEKFKVWQHTIDRKFCSKKCYWSSEQLKELQKVNIKKSRFPIGSNHHAWKGNGAGYISKHLWVKNHFGLPTTCEKCGKENLKGKYINWANISGKYLRKRKDWLRLCRKCHHQYDNISEKMWLTRKSYAK